MRPALDNKTRWSGKCTMVDRHCHICVHHCHICDDIVKASQEENSTVKIGAVASIPKARKVRNMPEEINTVTKALQESKLSLAQGFKCLDELGQQVHRAMTTTGNALSQCKLRLKKLALVSDLAPDHLFESGVIKIQSGH